MCRQLRQAYCVSQSVSQERVWYVNKRSATRLKKCMHAHHDLFFLRLWNVRMHTKMCTDTHGHTPTHTPNKTQSV